MKTSHLWKIYCEEERHPGMWQRWFKSQCVAVGWASADGFHLKGKTKFDHGWMRTRNLIQKIQTGDYIVVSLRGNRIGRIGEVTGTAIEDKDWNELVPRSKDYPNGEKGRRIFVRWDLEFGPDNRELVVTLPEDKQFNSGELRSTICKIRSQTLTTLRKAMKDSSNWVGLASKFSNENALSDYIATYPHRLEDGMLPHSNMKVRERVFADHKRSDVLLVDQHDKPVIVECKQEQPNVKDVHQLQNYLKKFSREERQKARGILVHGGSRKLQSDVRRAARTKPVIELVQFSVGVNFSKSE